MGADDPAGTRPVQLVPRVAAAFPTICVIAGIGSLLILTTCGKIEEPTPFRDLPLTPSSTQNSKPAPAFAELPADVVRKLNAEFGTAGQPHFVLLQGEWTDTGCLYWPSKMGVSLSGNPTEEADRALQKARELLVDDPVIAYKGNLWWLDVDVTTAERIVVVPTTDQYDVLRIERTNAANYGLETEDVINKLTELDEKYGISITGAGFAAVEFFLREAPKGAEADKLGEWLLDFCPDILEPPKSLDGRIALWWD
jgi:hypothetical protein